MLHVCIALKEQAFGSRKSWNLEDLDYVSSLYGVFLFASGPKIITLPGLDPDREIPISLK